MAKKSPERPGYQIETIPIDSLTLDPANVRLHPERNLEAIKASLRRFGQQKPIVVDGDGIVRAGNGTLVAAKSLGWTEIVVHRTSLKGADATAYAIADNRTGELAEWDDAKLQAQLASLAYVGVDPERDLQFDLPRDLLNESPGDQSDLLAEKYQVLVDCTDEADQVQLLEQLAEMGRTCRALSI